MLTLSLHMLYPVHVTLHLHLTPILQIPRTAMWGLAQPEKTKHDHLRRDTLSSIILSTIIPVSLRLGENSASCYSFSLQNSLACTSKTKIGGWIKVTSSGRTKQVFPIKTLKSFYPAVKFLRVVFGGHIVLEISQTFLRTKSLKLMQRSHRFYLIFSRYFLNFRLFQNVWSVGLTRTGRRKQTCLITFRVLDQYFPIRVL